MARTSVMPAGNGHHQEGTTTPNFGYARVSSPEQSLDRQVDELRGHGCDRVFPEVASGKRGAHRPQWDAFLAHLRARGRVGGRRRSYTTTQQREAQRLYDSGQLTVEQIARAVGARSSTVYRCYLALPGPAAGGQAVLR